MDMHVHGAAGGLIQLLAGMWEMWKANTFAATAFSSYGGFWMGWALYGILKSVCGPTCNSLGPGSSYLPWLLVGCVPEACNIPHLYQRTDDDNGKCAPNTSQAVSATKVTMRSM